MGRDHSSGTVPRKACIIFRSSPAANGKREMALPGDGGGHNMNEADFKEMK